MKDGSDPGRESGPRTDEASAQLRRYRVLLQTARYFGRAMDVHVLMDEILSRAREVMECEAVSILLPDKPTGDMLLMSTEDRLRAFSAALRVPQGKGIAGAVFRTKKVIRVQDASKDPRHDRRIGARLGNPTRAMLTIPLLDGDQCLGVMQALNPASGEDFDALGEEIFIGFGGLIVNALRRLESQEKEVDQARTERDLDLAQEIQKSFLPKEYHEFPYGRVRLQSFPARTVGGDFSFLHLLDDHRMLVGLGDVSGKGVPAALTMARATAMIRATVKHAAENAERWLIELNRQLCHDLSRGQFISLGLLLVDARRSSLGFCVAGLQPPLVTREGRWEVAAASCQMPLGILRSNTYRLDETELLPGDQWLLISDGITEARDQKGMELTAKGLIHRLESRLPPDDTVRRTLEVWRGFSEGTTQRDDATIVHLDWRAHQPESEFEVCCCPETTCSVRGFIERWAAYCGFDYLTRGQLVLAVDEAVTNVFRYAYQGESGPIRVRVQIEESDLVILIKDQGKAVDPSTIVVRDPSDIRPGGLGTLIISRVFDAVRRWSSEDTNLLELRRKRGPRSQTLRAGLRDRAAHGRPLGEDKGVMVPERSLPENSGRRNPG